MKAGGQNECVGINPVYLNRPTHILEQMYAGGWTTVVDTSKFFYQFKNHPADRKYLGILRPITGMQLREAPNIFAQHDHIVSYCSGRRPITSIVELHFVLYDIA
jgi:hypothetical protein